MKAKAPPTTPRAATGWARTAAPALEGALVVEAEAEAEAEVFRPEEPAVLVTSPVMTAVVLTPVLVVVKWLVVTVALEPVELVLWLVRLTVGMVELPEVVPVVAVAEEVEEWEVEVTDAVEVEVESVEELWADPVTLNWPVWARIPVFLGSSETRLIW